MNTDIHMSLFHVGSTYIISLRYHILCQFLVCVTINYDHEFPVRYEVLLVSALQIEQQNNNGGQLTISFNAEVMKSFLKGILDFRFW